MELLAVLAPALMAVAFLCGLALGDDDFRF